MVLYWPAGTGGQGLPYLDKVAHVAVFGAVALTGRLAGIAWSYLAAALVAHAVLSELVQGLVLPARQADPWDVAADLVGTALGLLAGARSRAPSRR